MDLFEYVTHFDIVSLGNRVRIFIDEFEELVELIHIFLKITKILHYLGSSMTLSFSSPYSQKYRSRQRGV